jgi:hypothetical protein
MILRKSDLSGKDMHRSCKRKKSSQALVAVIKMMRCLKKEET